MLTLEEKIERLVAYMDCFRQHGPMSAWRAAQHLGQPPQRAHRYARTLRRMGLIERIICGEKLAYRVTLSGRSELETIRTIGRHAGKAMHGKTEAYPRRAREASMIAYQLEQDLTQEVNS